MDARDHDELLKKQENLEAYLLENPQSELFSWYARQNMEAGELDRALKICRLGMQGSVNRGMLHKLMGEIYMAKGEVTQSMKHFVECILTRDPFPGVVIEVMKNLGPTLEGEQMALLVHLLNKALPGHPDATRFYKKNPGARDFVLQPGQYKFLEDLVDSLERSASVEIVTDDEHEFEEIVAPPQVEIVEPELKQEAELIEVIPEPEIEPKKEAELVEVIPTPEVVVEPEPEVVKVEPKKKPIPAQDPAVRHNITRSMATFTLMNIFKSQGLYENALEVLQLLREKSSNLERIESEEKEISALMAGNSQK